MGKFRKKIKFETWSKEKKRVTTIITAFVATIILSTIYYVVFSNFIYFGKDAELKKENRVLKEYIRTTDEKLTLLENATASLSHRDRKIYKSIFNSYPIDNLSESLRESSTYENKHEIERERIQKTLDNAKEVRTLIDSINSHLNYLGTSSYNIPSKIPVENFNISQIGASQGRKMNPFYKSVIAHNGVDIIALRNTKVIASAEGVVESVMTQENRGSGKMIIINHLNGYKTRYSNLANILVTQGAKIKSGQVIGTVGSSGMSLAPHLHYEVIFNGRYMNPVNYFFADINPDEYNQITILSENMGQSLD